MPGMWTLAARIVITARPSMNGTVLALLPSNPPIVMKQTKRERMKTLNTILSCLFITSLSHAQQELRGKVEDIRNTTGQFVLDGTTIPLISSTLDLNSLEQQGQHLVMTVVDVGTTGTILNVITTTPTTKILDMGNLRIGRSESWRVSGMSGSVAWVFAGARNSTSYLPLGPLGVWLLGSGARLLANGSVTSLGFYQFQFTMPNLPSLIGVEITSQAVVQEPGGKVLLTNPDSKVIQS